MGGGGALSDGTATAGESAATWATVDARVRWSGRAAAPLNGRAGSNPGAEVTGAEDADGGALPSGLGATAGATWPSAALGAGERSATVVPSAPATSGELALGPAPSMSGGLLTLWN